MRGLVRNYYVTDAVLGFIAWSVASLLLTENTHGFPSLMYYDK